MLFEWRIVRHTLKDTQRYHRYVPLSTTTLAVHEVSSGSRARVVSIVEALQIDISDVVKGNYVACMYDKKVWHGTVNDISEEFGDLLIRFMHPSGGMNQLYLFSLKVMIHAGLRKVTFFAPLTHLA